MTRRPALSAGDLDVMRRAASQIRTDVERGADPVADDVATLARFVVELVDEVDTLVWRSTLATMALDGRVSIDEVKLT